MELENALDEADNLDWVDMSVLHQHDMEAKLNALVEEDDKSIGTFTNALKPNATRAGGANASLAPS